MFDINVLFNQQKLVTCTGINAKYFEKLIIIIRYWKHWIMIQYLSNLLNIHMSKHGEQIYFFKCKNITIHCLKEIFDVDRVLHPTIIYSYLFFFFKNHLCNQVLKSVKQEAYQYVPFSREFTQVPWYIFSYYFGFFCSTFSHHVEKILNIYCLRQRSIWITYQRLYMVKYR